MNAHEKLDSIVEKYDKARDELENLIIGKLNRAAEQVRIIASKKSSNGIYSLPDCLEWTAPYGKKTIVEITGEYVKYFVAYERRHGEKEIVKYFTVSRKWLHYSVWEISHLTRVELSAYANDHRLAALKEEEKELERAQREMREREKSLYDQRKVYRKTLERVKEQRRALAEEKEAN